LTYLSSLTDLCAEKYLKKLVGWKDIEDALQRLDKLTQEEARMAAVEALKISRGIDYKVQGVDNRLKEVDERVGFVGGRLKSVDEKVGLVVESE